MRERRNHPILGSDRLPPARHPRVQMPLKRRLRRRIPPKTEWPHVSQSLAGLFSVNGPLRSFAGVGCSLGIGRAAGADGPSIQLPPAPPAPPRTWSLIDIWPCALYRSDSGGSSWDFHSGVLRLKIEPFMKLNVEVIF